MKLLPVVSLSLLAVAALAQQPERIELSLNTSEAEAVLAIVKHQAAGQAVSDADWQRLFATEPYGRLKKRESSLHRDFTDDDFRKFVLSPELARQAPELEAALSEWKRADLRAAAAHVLPYLPAQATIHAKVFPVIKPLTNSFVFEPAVDPTIFLYLNHAVTRAKFENTVAHECHHIGFASLEKEMESKLEGLPANVKPAVEWIGAFGEGFAMLAAAGNTEVHPHAISKAEDRDRWDLDSANFNRDLMTQDGFFLDIIHGKFKTKEQIDEVAFSFFGVQGPWYTVGYRMAATIEKQFGRATLVDCMTDLRKLLPTYNRAAGIHNRAGGEQLALWSPELVLAVQAGT